MKAIACQAALLLAAALFLPAGQAAAADNSPRMSSAQVGKVYELRTYVANPGKFEALLARFRDHTCTLFKKHGIEVVGFWTPRQGAAAGNTLIYLVVFPSVEAQKKAWAEFRADPDWIKAKAESEKDGPLLKKIPPDSVNLTPTDFSPLH